MIKQTNRSYFLKHVPELSRKYAGKHVAIVDRKIVAIGRKASVVFRKAIKNIPQNKPVGIFYLPTKNEALVFL